MQPEEDECSVFFAFYVPKYLFMCIGEDIGPENIRYYRKES